MKHRTPRKGPPLRDRSDMSLARCSRDLHVGEEKKQHDLTTEAQSALEWQWPEKKHL